MKKRTLRHLPWNTLPAIFSLAGPTMLEQLMQTAVQYIDTAMVGSLGTGATAAVGATTTVNWLVGSTVTALGVGFLSFIAQACGAGEKEKAKKLSAQAMFVVLVAGTMFTVLTLSLSGMIPTWMQVAEPLRHEASLYFFVLYLSMLPRTVQAIMGTVLRAAGDTKSPMRIGLWINAINIVMNCLLIFPSREISVFGLCITLPGANLGVEGAAAASSAAFLIGGILTMMIVWWHPVVSPKGTSVAPDPNILIPCMKVAWPNIVQRFVTSFGYVAFATMINGLGAVSTAAHTIANTVESAFYIPGYGIQTAAATLVGNALGAKNKQQMKDITRMLLLVEVALMVLSGALLYLFAPSMMALFSSGAGVVLMGTTVLRMVALSEPFYGVSIIIEGVLQGVGQTMAPFVFSTVSMWLIRIVGTYVTVTFFSGTLIAAWACMICHNLALFVMLILYYKKGKWNPLERYA